MIFALLAGFCGYHLGRRVAVKDRFGHGVDMWCRGYETAQSSYDAPTDGWARIQADIAARGLQ